jgi:hypothetical protein
LHCLTVVKRQLFFLAVLSASAVGLGPIGCDQGKDIGSGCRTADDCSDADSLCEIRGEPSCGICEEPDCAADADCEMGSVCVQDPCTCQQGGLRCKPACVAGGCGVDQRCADDGHCVAITCAEGCPSNFSCAGDGCTRKHCQDDDACDDGFCVEGLCSDEPGTCSYLE